MDFERDTVHSSAEALQIARVRKASGKPTFPAKVFAKGHAPDKEPVIVPDYLALGGIINQAIGASHFEFGNAAAEIIWSA
ncbi:MAG TPA: hypothetical protein VMU25_03925 [Candidatus Paceibacterota bacterium]|nr:hypothetical protein [Candidatus Paceibacterota bacterium]